MVIYDVQGLRKSCSWLWRSCAQAKIRRATSPAMQGTASSRSFAKGSKHAVPFMHASSVFVSLVVFLHRSTCPSVHDDVTQQHQHAVPYGLHRNEPSLLMACRCTVNSLHLYQVHRHLVFTRASPVPLRNESPRTSCVTWKAHSPRELGYDGIESCLPGNRLCARENCYCTTYKGDKRTCTED